MSGLNKLRVSEIIVQALGLVLAQGTSEVLARDKYGNEVRPTDFTACSFCSIGAVAKVANADAYVHWNEIPGVRFLNQATRDHFPKVAHHIEVWQANDAITALAHHGIVQVFTEAGYNQPTKEDLTAIFKRAAELARAEEGVCAI